MNVYHTQYEIIRIVAKELDFRLREEDPNIVPNINNQGGTQGQIPEFDVVWLDLGVSAEVLSKLKPHQRMTQYPGIYNIARKNNLARNLMKIKKICPNDYNFFPQTY